MKYSLALSVALLGVNAQSTPVQKVIDLITNLRDQTQAEGQSEQDVYDKYSCFCKENSDEKSDDIMTLQDKIDGLAASIEEGAGTRDRLTTEIAELQAEIQKLDNEMRAEKQSHLKDRTHREAVIADLDKAVFSLNGAVDAVKNSQSQPEEVMLSVKSTIKKNLMIAEMLGLKSARQGKSFLQAQEPDYEFHSGGILDTLRDLQDDFSNKLTDNQEELQKAINAHEALMESKQNARKAADDSSKKKTTEKDDTVRQLGEDKESLTSARKSLSDTQLYMKDLTAQCELKAREYDQRMGMRNAELEALNKALTLLTEKVQSNDESANKRAFLNEQRAVVKRVVTEDVSDDDISFIQLSSKKVSLKSYKANKVVSDLAKAASKMNNQVLLSFAMRLKDGTFDKVKKLIAQLIERLLQESADEASHKGWCDSELAKATKERDYKTEDVNQLNADVAEAEATKKKNAADVRKLIEQIDSTTQELADADNARAEEKDNNVRTLKDAKEGHEAVSQAIKILKDFYYGEHGVGGANSASVSLVQLEASPVAENTDNRGAYQGNQDAASGILGMLDVIRSDFERTLERTAASEKEAAMAHVKFSRESKVFLAGAETEKKNKENVVKQMTHAINTGMEDLKDTVALVDAAVKTLEDLQPACVDTGMSYKERKEKRQEEIDALKTALCQLDPDNKEDMCL